MKSHIAARVVLVAFLSSVVLPHIQTVTAQGDSRTQGNDQANIPGNDQNNNQGKNQKNNQGKNRENSQSANRLVVPVSGTVNGVAGTLRGTFAISEFGMRNGVLTALGTLTASVADATGNIARTIVTPAALPVTTPAAPVATAAARVATPAAPVVTPAAPVAPAQATTCGILNLVLGPLDLDLLGLVVHLDVVVLDITAEPGPGNLLGNLLCAVAGLLDGNPTGQQLLQPLNQILSALAGG